MNKYFQPLADKSCLSSPRRSKYKNLIIVIASIIFSYPAASAESGVTDTTITFGQAAALEGPAAALGLDMRQGLLAAFGEANRAGGVNGRRLELISRDDGYEPSKSIAAVKTLLDDDHVFGLIGSVGTPTSMATQPIAEQAGVPFIGPFTGAEFLRDSDKKSVINVRASYFQETEAMVEHLTKDLAFTRIAILFQDDAFGRAGFAGVEKALGRRSMKLVSDGSFDRNTTAIKRALLDIRAGNPEAVILVATYEPAAAFIRLARQLKLDALFVNISFVGSDALAKALGEDGAGVVVSQVVPLPTDASLLFVGRYLAALRAIDPLAEPGFVTLEGYLVGRLTIAALERIPDVPTDASLIAAIRDNTFDLDGLILTYPPGRNQGSNAVYLTMIRADGSFQAIKSLREALPNKQTLHLAPLRGPRIATAGQRR